MRELGVALLPVIGFLLGFFAIWYKNIIIPSEYASYISLAAIAGVDTLLGGLRSGLEGRFKSDIFLSGFLANTLMAALIAYFGDQIGLPEMYMAAVVVFGLRIFLNLSLIRRQLLGRPRHRSTLQDAGVSGIAAMAGMTGVPAPILAEGSSPPDPPADATDAVVRA